MEAQISELGLASDFAGLELNSSATFTISKSTTVITGNVGVVSNGNFSYTGGGHIYGAIDAGSAANLTITGGSSASGGTVDPDAQMTKIVQDAENAATYYAGLAATQTFSSIGSSQTFVGTGGLDVIQVNGDIDIQGGGTLTLSGNSSDQFVIDVNDAGVSGNPPDLTLGGGSSIVLNGISASQVVFNLIGTGTQLSTTGESATSGVFLAADGAISISGGVHDSEFIAGDNLTFSIRCEHHTTDDRAGSGTQRPADGPGRAGLELGLGAANRGHQEAKRRGRRLGVGAQPRVPIVEGAQSTGAPLPKGGSAHEYPRAIPRV